MTDRLELRALQIVKKYYEKMGFQVLDVSQTGGHHGGYDFVVTDESKAMKVEVKGCTAMYGIPDPYHTEFDHETRQLIAVSNNCKTWMDLSSHLVD